ncbi:MAG: hypothetical protein AB1758_02865 [Candidatus Eremiobacterota bacterium]
MQIQADVRYAGLTQAAARKMPDSGRGRESEPGPDDVSDPDYGGRNREPGPDDVYDPDFGGRGGGDSYSGPDGTYSYDPYH